MNMKKYTASAKGFTLVELIVVIVILAILATIAFLSFSSQSSAARDSKRKTDLSSIASKINVTQAQGTSLLAMVGTKDKKLTSGYLAGVAMSTFTDETKYNAGKINYSVIGVKADDFKDPNGDEYPIGATTIAGGSFHLAAKVENDADGNPATNGAVVSGNFAHRSSSGATAVTLSSSGVFNVSSASSQGFFKVGDTVLVGTSTTPTTIKSISTDKSKITVNDKDATGTQIALAYDGAEVISLIAGKTANTPVEDGVNAPY